MSITVFVPSIGLDRSQRAQPLEPAARPDASAKEYQAVAPDPIRVGSADGTGAPGQAGSGLGEKAQENLFRSKVEKSPSGEEFSEEEQTQIRDLKARDTEVRRHEEAHARVGGQYAGQPTYTYQTGPDGKRYAIGGEVSIDVSPVPDDPQATIAKMDVVIAAALAPAEPSGQDRKVASQAASQRLEATADLAEQRREQQNAQSPRIDGNAKSIDAAGRSPTFDLAA